MTIASFGTAIEALPAGTTVGSALTAEDWAVSLRKMTSEAFQGKVVVETNTGIRATINISDNYYAEIANNGKGINFRPKTPVNPEYPDAGLIRIMEPTPDYPKGYVRFYNDYGQPMNNPDVNTNPGSGNETHFEF